MRFRTRSTSRTPDNPDDDAIAEVLDLVEHASKRGGFLGFSESVHGLTSKALLTHSVGFAEHKV